MRVVLDSSVITERDWHLASAAASALLSAARRAQLQLVVPEVVVREVSTKLRERERDTLRKVNDSRAALRKLQASFSQDARSADDYHLVGDKIEADLRRRLEIAHVEITPLPEVSHSDLVDRALARRRPFDKQGRKGYRDALIWQTVLDGANANTVTVFGANNPEDFADERDKSKLHPDLVEDLSARGLGASAVVLADSLDAVVRRVLEPARALLSELQQRLIDDDPWQTDLEEDIKALITAEGHYVDDSAVDVQIEDRGEPFADGIEDESLDDIVYRGGLTVADAWALSDDEFAIELRAHVDAVYDVQVSTAVFWRNPDLVPTGLDLSADERYATFAGFADAVAHIEGRYRRSTGVIEHLSLQHLSS
jgi:hypothetical protein